MMYTDRTGKSACKLALAKGCGRDNNYVEISENKPRRSGNTIKTTWRALGLLPIDINITR